MLINMKIVTFKIYDGRFSEYLIVITNKKLHTVAQNSRNFQNVFHYGLVNIF